MRPGLYRNQEPIESWAVGRTVEAGVPFSVPSSAHRGTVRLKKADLYLCHVIKWEDCAHLWFVAYPVGSCMLRGLKKCSGGVATPLENV